MLSHLVNIPLLTLAFASPSHRSFLEGTTNGPSPTSADAPRISYGETPEGAPFRSVRVSGFPTGSTTTGSEDNSSQLYFVLEGPLTKPQHLRPWVIPDLIADDSDDESRWLMEGKIKETPGSYSAAAKELEEQIKHVGSTSPRPRVRDEDEVGGEEDFRQPLHAFWDRTYGGQNRKAKSPEERSLALIMPLMKLVLPRLDGSCDSDVIYARDFYPKKRLLYDDERVQGKWRDLEEDTLPFAAKAHLAYQRLTWALLENSGRDQRQVFVAYVSAKDPADLYNHGANGLKDWANNLQMVMGVLYNPSVGLGSGLLEHVYTDTQCWRDDRGVSTPEEDAKMGGRTEALSQHIGIHKIPFNPSSAKISLPLHYAASWLLKDYCGKNNLPEPAEMQTTPLAPMRKLLDEHHAANIRYVPRADMERAFDMNFWDQLQGGRFAHLGEGKGLQTPTGHCVKEALVMLKEGHAMVASCGRPGCGGESSSCQDPQWHCRFCGVVDRPNAHKSYQEWLRDITAGRIFVGGVLVAGRPALLRRSRTMFGPRGGQEAPLGCLSFPQYCMLGIKRNVAEFLSDPEEDECMPDLLVFRRGGDGIGIPFNSLAESFERKVFAGKGW